VKPEVDAPEVGAALGRQLAFDPYRLDAVRLEYCRLPSLLDGADALAELAEHERLERIINGAVEDLSWSTQ
jgi:hypothetical protein